MGRGAWWATVYGVAQSQTWLKWLSTASSTALIIRHVYRMPSIYPVLDKYKDNKKKTGFLENKTCDRLGEMKEIRNRLISGLQRKWCQREQVSWKDYRMSSGEDGSEFTHWRKLTELSYPCLQHRCCFAAICWQYTQWDPFYEFSNYLPRSHVYLLGTW